LGPAARRSDRLILQTTPHASLIVRGGRRRCDSRRADVYSARRAGMGTEPGRATASRRLPAALISAVEGIREGIGLLLWRRCRPTKRAAGLGPSRWWTPCRAAVRVTTHRLAAETRHRARRRQRFRAPAPMPIVVRAPNRHSTADGGGADTGWGLCLSREADVLPCMESSLAWLPHRRNVPARGVGP
jgi:hypothetical protein